MDISDFPPSIIDGDLTIYLCKKCKGYFDKNHKCDRNELSFCTYDIFKHHTKTQYVSDTKMCDMCICAKEEWCYCDKHLPKRD